MPDIKAILMEYHLIDLAYALILFLVGWSLIGWFKRRLPKLLVRVKLDETLKPFLASFTIMVLKILLIITVIQKIGIETTSIIAVLGAASLAIGLAFQGTLSNFASGIMLLTLRPFRVGDYIEAAGFGGTVEGIHIFNTQIVTPDHKVAIIPNSLLFNGSILNYSIKPTRRIDLTFSIGYSQDIENAKDLLIQLVSAHPLVLQEPAPLVAVSAHTPHALSLLVRIWVRSEDYWTVHYNLLESVKNLFEQANIPVPYPQIDLSMIGRSTNV